MLTRAQQTVATILISDLSFDSIFRKAFGRIPCKMVYLFRTKPITRSTWMRTFANFCVASTSLGESWRRPLVKAGIFTSAHINPRSASTMSPGSSFSNKLQWSVKNLSLAFPPQACDRNDTVPCRVTPIKNFTVLWCL